MQLSNLKSLFIVRKQCLLDFHRRFCLPSTVQKRKRNENKNFLIFMTTKTMTYKSKNDVFVFILSVEMVKA